MILTVGSESSLVPSTINRTPLINLESIFQANINLLSSYLYYFSGRTFFSSHSHSNQYFLPIIIVERMDISREIAELKFEIRKLAENIAKADISAHSVDKDTVAAWRAEKLALNQQLTEYVKHLGLPGVLVSVPPKPESPGRSIMSPSVLSPMSRGGDVGKSCRGYSLTDDNTEEVKTVRQKLLSGEQNSVLDNGDDVVLRDGSHITRKKSVVDREVRARSNIASHINEMLPAESTSLPELSAYLPSILSSAIFCGHLVTDLDSIAGAIGAAELYGGLPARASETNSETNFALNYWGMPKPLPIEELLESQPSAGICLVDHQQLSQVHPDIAIHSERIVGVIDHHALQNSTIVTEKPIYMDIRPWGSMSTIISHSYLVHQRRPRTCVAGMLLCAILSDTLNLLGPTTTDYDRMMVAILCEICNVADINVLAKMQFHAKSQELERKFIYFLCHIDCCIWVLLHTCLQYFAIVMTANQLCTGDMKQFSFNTANFSGTIAFAVIETIADEVILRRKEDLLEQMEYVKSESGVTMYFLAVVNITPPMHSTLLLVSPMESSLATQSFPSLAPGNVLCDDDNRILDLGTRVSRKKNFIPSVTRVINKEGWSWGSEE